MKNIFKYVIVCLPIVLFGCGTNHDQPVKEENDHATEMPEDEVHLTPKQVELMGITLGKPQGMTLSNTVKSNGHLQLPPQKKASLSAVLGGRVKDVLVLEGNRVSKGQVLARLEHPDFIEMQEQYLSALSEMEYVQNELKRKKQLHADSISSTRQLQETQAAFTAVEARLNGLKAKLNMLNVNTDALEKGSFTQAIPIRSPIDGYVRLVEVNIGKYVQPQQEMFEIVDNAHIHIDLMVFEKDVHKVKDGQKVLFKLTTGNDSVYAGKIFSVGRAFEEDPKAMAVHAEIDNKSGTLLPGMYVDARIIIGKDSVQVLPDDAVVEDESLNYVFVLKPGKNENEYAFKRIEVKTGTKDLGYTEVKPIYNLPEKVQYVTHGAYYLLAQLKKGKGGGGGHGHSHSH